MAFQKMSKTQYPPRQWALVGYPGAGKSTFAARMFAAVLVALVITLALLRPAKADSTQPPSVGDPPTMLHLVYLPIVTTSGGVQAAVSWCPSCRG